MASGDAGTSDGLGREEHSRTKSLVKATQEADSQTDGPDPAQSNLEGVAASAIPAAVEPNGGPLVVLNDVGRAEPNAGPIIALHGVAPAQSNVGLIVAPLGDVFAQPNIAPNVAPPAPGVLASNVAPRRVAPVQSDVAPHAQRNGAPPAPAHLNAALIVAPLGEALVLPNAAAIVAPRAVGVLDVNCGLSHSRLKPLRICEIGLGGHFWPKLP